MNIKHKMQELQELAFKDGPLCVGLDTDPSYLPESVIKAVGSKEEAVLTYNKEIIRRISSDKSACCCKVQIAYYEAMGLKGMKIYAETLKAVKESGLICISDIKRGDIAATQDAYARAHFTGDFETDTHHRVCIPRKAKWLWQQGIRLNPLLPKPLTDQSFFNRKNKGA